MALVVANRVQETSSSSGTGSLVLAGAVSGYQTFASGIGNANTTYYTLYDSVANVWEVGIGTVTVNTPSELSRDTILANSSGTTSPLTLAGNTINVWCDYPASKAVYKDASGDVTLATNSSSTALLITQTGSGNAIVVEDSANPDSTPFVIDTAGRVLIGTTAAQTMAGTTPVMQQHAATSSAQSALVSWGTNSLNRGDIQFLRSASGVVGTQGAVASGYDLGALNFYGDDGTAFIQAAQILSEVDGTPGTNDMPGRLVFSTTADGASSPTERMRIDNAGRVGIGGTPSAGQRLLLAGNLTGATTAYGQWNYLTPQSDVTNAGIGYATNLQTAAASFTISELTHYKAIQGGLGAGSTVTNQYGFNVTSSLTGATNNYGFYSNIASGTGRWNFYAAGTAANYFAGAVTIDGTATLATGAVLNTPASGTLTNCTGLPVSTGVSGLGSNVATFLATPSSANLAAAVTDETGSGALVFATSPTLVTPALGTPTSGTLSNCTVDGTDAVGFRNIPQNAQTGSYTLVAADSGKHIYHASGAGAATYTIPANGSVAYAIGTALTFVNMSATSISIAITTDTMYLAGAGTTGTRTLAQYGTATALKLTSTTWVISGAGLS